MKLPFVARSTYDLIREDLAKAEARETHWVERHDALLVQFTTMTARAVPEPVKIPERTKDEVIEAIHARAGTNGQVRSCLSTWAMQQRRNKVPDDQIITGILVWASDDDSQDGML